MTTLDYSTTRKLCMQRRRAIRIKATGSAILVVIMLGSSAILIENLRPWVWYGSKRAYQMHEYLAFTMKRGSVVYEEDPALAAKLLASQPDPTRVFVGDPHDGQFLVICETSDYRNARRTRDLIAEYVPPSFRAFMGPSGSLVFMHDRVNPTGIHRLVTVLRDYERPPLMTGNESQFERSFICLGARSDSITGRLTFKHSNIRVIFVQLNEKQVMRIFAGQADPSDDSHFTIKYEIDNKPGTIDGWLQADDTVKLQIRDGPAKQP